MHGSMSHSSALNKIHLFPITMSISADAMVLAEQQIAAEHQIREKAINEEFKIWKKTVPLLYNVIHTHAMQWPLLTVDFLPKYEYSEDKQTISVSFMTGTNTSLGGADSIKLSSLSLPATLAPDFSSVSGVETLPIPGPGKPTGNTQVVRQWPHPGEANRIKISPKGDKFATFDNAGTVHVYDIASSEAPLDLKYHATEGYCLDWVSDTDFLSAANDGKIVLWNVHEPSSPKAQFLSHTAAVNDISYSKPSKYLFGSVADDFTTQIHDLRSSQDSPAIRLTNSHLQNAIQFHPELSYLFATGGKENLVSLYDARNLSSPVRQFYGHQDSVVGLRWNTLEPLLLLSWSLDKRLIAWDLTYLSEEYAPSSEATEGKKKNKQTDDPCLHFIHGGHTNRVNDVAVHPTIPQLFATVGDDSLLEIFQPKTVFSDEAQDDEEEDEEEEKDEKEDAETSGATNGASKLEGASPDDGANSGEPIDTHMEDVNGADGSEVDAERL